MDAKLFQRMRQLRRELHEIGEKTSTEDAYAMYEAGATLAQVAAQFGATPQNWSRRFKTANLPLRRRGAPEVRPDPREKMRVGECTCGAPLYGATEDGVTWRLCLSCGFEEWRGGDGTVIPGIIGGETEIVG